MKKQSMLGERGKVGVMWVKGRSDATAEAFAKVFHPNTRPLAHGTTVYATVLLLLLLLKLNLIEKLLLLLFVVERRKKKQVLLSILLLGLDLHITLFAWSNQITKYNINQQQFLPNALMPQLLAEVTKGPARHHGACATKRRWEGTSRN